MAREAALLLFIINVVSAEILTPPYFNLALGKKITATATCGDEGVELYCKLVGANADHDEHVIQGQVCDVCDANNETKKHPPEYAVDGMETWWQSPPLSRGMKYNEVTLTIDLGQEFHVAYVFVRMGNSPRPGVWALEKSTDYGKTFQPWQYFTDSQQDCERYFGKESIQPITRDDSVICSTEYSKIVPLEGGEIPIPLLTYRPSANKYFNSSVLQEWTRATNVRLRFIQTKNLYGHLMSVARQDPTVTRRYFYSIKDISIGGRCMCNGHADNCDPAEPESETNILVCRCQHNTCGPQCNKCCAGFEQKKWRISQNWDRFACEPCNCNNHTSECVYDPEVDEKRMSLDIHGRYEGGGVCQNCQHNTEGINCNKCKPTYYRPYGKRWEDLDVCQPCNCDLHFSTGNCAEETGRCECRPEFVAPLCDSCSYGYYDFPNCKPCPCNLNGTDGEYCTPQEGKCPCKYNYDGDSCEICKDGFYSPECKNCECNSVGSVSQICDKETGNCTCKSKYSGRTCNQCEAGYFNYPACKHCNCDTSGTQPNICDDVTGQCICKDGFGGQRCDQCLSGFFMEVRGRERLCVPCNCSTTGSTSTSCSSEGKCNCLANFGGKQCNQCSAGYYKYPDCLPCNCDTSGSIGSTCDETGLCHCKPNFDGVKCDHCKEQFYNYPACEECNCDPKGVIASFAGCGSVPAGELCQCKDRVQGRICNDCQPLYWNLQEYNPQGCDECRCHLPGTMGGLGTCNTKTGQCNCKAHVGERTCNQCRDGFYKLQNYNIFGCSECDCDIGGSVDNSCDKNTGQCHCHSRVQGRRCDEPIEAHYFPTLHQFQYEVEEGLTQSGPVRYKNSDDLFPGYSWKGYVVFSHLQNEVINVVYIRKSSFYRMVLKYVNRLSDPVTASIIITPESTNDIQQKFIVNLKPTSSPQLITVSGEKGNIPSPFVMNPGNWTVTIKTNKEVMIDYFVLIPQAYYEATILTKVVDKPCVIGDPNLCRHFAYPSLSGRAKADAKTLATSNSEYITNDDQLKELNVRATDIPIIDIDHSLQYNIKIEPNGPYVLVVEYVTPVSDNTIGVLTDDDNRTNVFAPPKGVVTIRFQSGSGPSIYTIVNLNDCPYTSACRQAVIDSDAKIFVVNVEDLNNDIYLDAERGTIAGIKSIVAIPESEWHLDYITPKSYCLRKYGKCDPGGFSAIDAKKVEIESGSGGDNETKPQNIDGSTSVVYLTPLTEPITLESKVPAPGEYMILVHYYQPDNPESTVGATLNLNGQLYEAVLPIEHCPSTTGCRALLKLPDGRPQFTINDNFTLTFRGDKSKGVWLDYFLVIAAPNKVNTALREANMLDYTREFIEKCAINQYYIDPSTTGFCRDAVFSITAEYNSGTLRCVCDFEGSTDLECEAFGGQCRCRDNVIGRTCSACKTGYYGFPNCRPCSCPSTAICDDYGTCICPKNVVGENCDTCKDYTFNYDEMRGCDDCNCNALGVVNNNLRCDGFSGKCSCKENVIGRMCDHCTPGNYAFPDCVSCSCDRNGTTDEVCDQNTAQCYCKKHVTGQACDTCREEYFNLQSDNPEGCMKCHCFGKTTRCSSSYLTWVDITGMTKWSLANVELNKTLDIYPLGISPTQINDTVIIADIIDNTEKILFFGAPDHYLGKRLDSYGGYLSYKIYFTDQLGGQAIFAPDVIIGGANKYIVHYSIELPPSLTTWEHRVRMSEDEFVNLDGSAVTRDQFMNILVNITSIYIRGVYEGGTISVRLMDATLEVGVDDYIDYGRRASSVEQCQCPKAYKGFSCEQCASGYYRLSSGPHAGFCVPCQCNGHTNECDVNTGICLDCAHSTMGDHCEQCIPGYHGDATYGTPSDCLICACPLPYTSNNFAIGCDLSENGSLISCDCKEGYGGPRCEYCTAGFYGIPEKEGDYCKPCNCSGNINNQDPESCDSINGDCLKCVNNTAGQACNLCAPGFFGDAIFSKNCTACICDDFGMDYCNHTTGTCVCRPGVIGEKCDRCAPDHWGLNSGRGCTPCDCGLASDSTQCDDNTGQCRCAKGVTGRHCDQCAAGYWNYTKEGCDHCNCNKGYSVGFMCNATGQCECLPGVIGEKCDKCPERWVFVAQEGCQQCDSCTDDLVTSVERMSNTLINETQDFKNKADSFFTTQRLNYISNQTQNLRPRVSDLQNVDIDEATSAVNGLEATVKSLLRSAEFAATDSDEQITQAAELATAANKVLDSVRENRLKTEDVVNHVAELATGLELSQQPKVDSAVSEATQIKNDIKEKDFDPREEQSNAAYSNATAQIERMNLFVAPVNQQAKKFENLVNSTRILKDKMKEMLSFSEEAQRTSDAADRINKQNRYSKFGNKVSSVTKLNNDAMKDLIDAALYISNATFFNHLASKTAENASKALQDNVNINTETAERLAQIEEVVPDLKNLTYVAFGHANILRNRADNLRDLAQRESNNTRTQHAYSAASAYSSIVQEIKDAKEAADEAEAALKDATRAFTLLKDNFQPTPKRLEVLRIIKEAQSQPNPDEELRPTLDGAERDLQNAWNTLRNADDNEQAIQLSLPSVGQISLQDDSDNAENLVSKLNDTNNVMNRLNAELTASKASALILPKQADDAQKWASNAESLINIINDMNPNITNTYRAVKQRQEDLERRRREADDSLNKVKDLIEQARTTLNRVQVGVNFDRWSTLQPRLPDTVEEMSTSTHVSTFFKTKENDGLLLYLGNPKDTMLRRTKSDDFMVLGIQNGYPYLVMDIGDSAESGRDPAKISSDKFVADNRWYQIIVDRVGRNVKLSIRESLDNGTETVHSKEAVLPGQHTIFNLDPKKSKLYVGGVPSNAKLQGIIFPAFEGNIEELMIGETPVGLWNFVNASGLTGARQREKLLNLQYGPLEYRFNGRGHVTIPGKRHLEPQKNQILLFFRTYAPDGLIYLVGNKSSHFFSIQMQGGKVYLQVALGNSEDLVIIGTTKSYNDGRWHKLDAGRYLAKCSLKVDNEIHTMSSSSNSREIKEVETMNFGGDNKGIIPVTDKGFDGCMRQISIDNLNVDLTNNVESIGVSNGCQFSSLVSLSGEESFLRFVDISTENIQLTLKFKTSKPDGLLFLYINRMQTTAMSDSISLSLINGKLVLISQREQLDTRHNTYNDSQWHVVTVTHNNKSLRLVVDDFDYFSTDTPPEPLNILDGVLFIGGVQPNYVVGGKVGTKTPFQGCIADATINGRVLYLLEPFANQSVTFGRCGATTTIGGVPSNQDIFSPKVDDDVLPLPPVQVPYQPEEPPEQTTVKNQQFNEVVPTEAQPPSRAETPVWTTTPRIPLKPEAGCALAYDPHYGIGDSEEGYRFGTRNNSHIKYGKLPGRQGDGFDLTIRFRTFDEHGGLMFYAEAETGPDNFLAIFMKNAKIHVSFNCGGETGTIVSPLTYNDTEWHALTVVRNEGHGKLTVNSELVGETSVSCSSPGVLTHPYYYGGLDNMTQSFATNLENFYQPFQGCLKGLMMNGQAVTDILERHFSLRCIDSIEGGIYFGASSNTRSNYLKVVMDHFKVGLEASISMEIKPRNSTGLLLSVHGKTDFFVLELLDHEIVANVENGKGPFSASFKLANKFTLCDGKWHRIHAVKSRNVVSVGVDGRFSNAVIGQSASTDTKSAIYIGGHERAISKIKGSKSKRGFTGCIRNIMIKDKAVKIPLTAAKRNTHIGACPTD